MKNMTWLHITETDCIKLLLLFAFEFILEFIKPMKFRLRFSFDCL